MKHWITRLRVALALRIAPPGTTVVPPLRTSTLPRPDIARDPYAASRKIVKIEIPGKTKAKPQTRLYIHSCRDPLMWYYGLQGTYVDHLGTWPGEGYKSIDTGGYVNIVKFTDATPHSFDTWGYEK